MPAASSAARRMVAVRWALLLVGVALAVAASRGSSVPSLSLSHVVILAVAAAVAVVPALRRRVLDVLRAADAVSPQRRARLACWIAVGAALIVALDAFARGRDLQPRWHDELSYATQVSQVLAGKLWWPRHALADFFDSHYLLIDRVYASMYFPGIAILHAPGRLLGLPFWVTSVAIAGIAVGLIYRVVAEVVGGSAGLLAAVVAVAIFPVRIFGSMLMASVPVLALGALVVLAWLKWRRAGSLRWALGLGVATGLLVITRPVDALVIVGGLAIGLLPDLVGRRRDVALGTVALGLVGVAPFLGLQATYNHAVTGTWSKFPLTHYVERDFPKATFGFHERTAEDVPRTVIPQKAEFYYEWVAPRIDHHRPAGILAAWAAYRTALTVWCWTPDRMLLALVPLGLLGVRFRRRAAIVLAIPWFVGLYSFYCFHLEHYALVTTLAAVLLIASGLRELPGLVPRWREAVRVFGALTALGLCAHALSPHALPARGALLHEELRLIDRVVAELPLKPAIVLFRWAPSTNLHDEPVYNPDVAWPDDAEVIRAHDLGPRNVELARYYAERQPGRHLYAFDREAKTLRYFGSIGELWRRHAASAQTPTPTPTPTPVATD